MAWRTVWFGLLLAALTSVCMPRAAIAVQSNMQILALLANAQTRGERGDLAGALQLAAQAEALAPEHPEVHATLALLYHRRGSTEQAARHYAQFQLLSLRAHGCSDDDRTQALAEGEATMVLLANSERQAHRLPLLRPDLRLTEMARQHSEEMRDLGYFSHESPTRRNVDMGERFRHIFGRPAQALAENIARMSGTLWCFTPENLRESHERLMRSAGHRANILWDQPRSIGVGIALNSRGDYWITECFALIDR